MKVLLVCTGNTCRSPMAEAILRRIVAERGLDRVEVASAGVGAFEGSPASEGAYLVAIEHGLDLSAHRARTVTRELLAQADLVLTMSAGHAARVAALGAAGKVFRLGDYAGRAPAEADVPDPFGGDLEEYRATFACLADLLEDAVARLAAEPSR